MSHSEKNASIDTNTIDLDILDSHFSYSADGVVLTLSGAGEYVIRNDLKTFSAVDPKPRYDIKLRLVFERLEFSSCGKFLRRKRQLR